MPAPPPESPTPEEELRRAELLEELKLKTDQVTDDSLARTRRVMQMCKDTEDAGIATMVALDDQGGKMENIEKGREAIDKYMEEAKENLGSGRNVAMGLIRSGEEDALWQGNDDNINADDDGNNTDPGGGGIQNTGIHGGYIAKYYDIVKYTNDAREEEMNKNIEEVSNMVGNLRNMATDMGLGIGNQNVQLGRISLKAEDNAVHNLLK